MFVIKLQVKSGGWKESNLHVPNTTTAALSIKLQPKVVDREGLEPSTKRLKVVCSAIELPIRIKVFFKLHNEISEYVCLISFWSTRLRVKDLPESSQSYSVLFFCCDWFVLHSTLKWYTGWELNPHLGVIYSKRV